MLKIRSETKCNKYVLRFHHEKNVLSSKPIAAKRSKSVCFFLCNVCDFLNLSIFVREYSTRRPGTSHSTQRYVTKPQTSHNNMQKTRPRYLNLEIFYWGSVFARKKKNTVHSSNVFSPYFVEHVLLAYLIFSPTKMSN